MPLHSVTDPTSSDFARNSEAMRALVAELREKLDQVAGGGGEASRKRHTSRGKMLARQRVDLLIDPGTAFLELSPLAALGLYGVMSYNVTLRTSEIGIRMALGAERGSVVVMVMRGAVMQTLLGLAIGIPVAFVCVRFVKAQLYEITTADARVMAGAIVTLAVAACVAGLIPARRAASIDPMRALRVE